MGHSTGISDSYYRPTENDLLQDYLKCIDALTIQKNETILQEQVEDLKEKSRDNEYVVNAKLQEKDEQIQWIKQQTGKIAIQLITKPNVDVLPLIRQHLKIYTMVELTQKIYNLQNI
jgi:hypothetical protein